MKYIILYFYSVICIFSLNAQETINIKFNEADPLWVHTVIDSNFKEVSGQPYLTKYSVTYPWIVSRSDKYLYTLSLGQKFGSIPDDFGFLLDKIEIPSGIKKWSHNNTFYNSGNQDFYNTIDYDIYGNVELFGLERYSNLNNLNWSLGGSNSKLIKKVIDHKNGVLLDKIVNKDSLYTNYPPLPIQRFRQFKISDTTFLASYLIGSDTGNISTPKYTFGFNYQLNNANLEKVNVGRMLFNFDSIGDFSFDQPSFIHKLNKRSLISLAYKDRYESWSNLGTKIMWTDISNPNEIKIKLIKDFKDIIPGTKESFILHRFNVLNNTIYLSHYYPNLDIGKYTSYILWLDSIGEIKTFIPIPKNGSHIYQFADMIYANNDFAYLFSFPSVTGKQGFDIVRIESGSDTIQFISSITVKNEGEEFGTQVNALYDDGYLIFGGLTSKIGQGTKTSTKYYCFKASDLGINFKPVETQNSLSKPSKLDLFPNPTSNTLYLKLSSLERDLRISIYDLNGKLVFGDKLQLMINQIDVSGLTKGVYMINLSTPDGKKIGKTEKMVKIE